MLDKDKAADVAVIMMEMASKVLGSPFDVFWAQGERAGFWLLCAYFIEFCLIVVARLIERISWFSGFSGNIDSFVVVAVWVFVITSGLLVIVFFGTVVRVAIFYFKNKKLILRDDAKRRISVEIEFLDRLSRFSADELYHAAAAFRGRWRMRCGRIRSVSGAVEKIGLFPIVLGFAVTYHELLGGVGFEKIKEGGESFVYFFIMVSAAIVYVVCWRRWPADSESGRPAADKGVPCAGRDYLPIPPWWPQLPASSR